MRFTSKNNSTLELEQVELLELISRKYKVPEFTNEVIVESKTVPHSHPILTLNTRTQDELEVLKTLAHEQFHWYAANHPKYLECIEFLKSKYSEDSDYNKAENHPNSYWEHIIVCFNTRNYLEKILSSKDVIYVYSLWQPYPTIEKLIAERFNEVKKDLEQFDLIYTP